MHKVEKIYEHILNHKSFGHKSWPTKRCMDNNFKSNFTWFGEQGHNPSPFYFTKQVQLIKNKKNQFGF